MTQAYVAWSILACAVVLAVAGFGLLIGASGWIAIPFIGFGLPLVLLGVLVVVGGVVGVGIATLVRPTEPAS